MTRSDKLEINDRVRVGVGPYNLQQGLQVFFYFFPGKTKSILPLSLQTKQV